MKYFFVFIIAFYSAFSGYARGEDILLFTVDGKFSDKYNQYLRTDGLVSGDAILFNNGKKFIINKVLGHGSTTKIFEVIDDKTNQVFALRLPLKVGYNEYNTPFYRYIDSSYLGSSRLREANLPIPKVYSHYKGQYLLTEKIDFLFDGDTFFRAPQTQSANTIEKAQQALIRFAKETAHIVEIGDFKPEQLVYIEKDNRWLILDYTDLRRDFSSVTANENHLFRSFQKMLILQKDKDGNPIRSSQRNRGKKIGQYYYLERRITKREELILAKIEESIIEERFSIKEKRGIFEKELIQSIDNFDPKRASKVDYLKILAPKYNGVTPELSSKLNEFYNKYLQNFLVRSDVTVGDINFVLSRNYWFGDKIGDFYEKGFQAIRNTDDFIKYFSPNIVTENLFGSIDNTFSYLLQKEGAIEKFFVLSQSTDQLSQFLEKFVYYYSGNMDKIEFLEKIDYFLSKYSHLKHYRLEFNQFLVRVMNENRIVLPSYDFYKRLLNLSNIEMMTAERILLSAKTNLKDIPLIIELAESSPKLQYSTLNCSLRYLR